MKVAILGFGTVGVGVYEMLEKCPGLEPGPVLVRKGKEDKPFKVSSIEQIVNDPSDESTDMTTYFVGDWYRETRYLLRDYPCSGKAQNARILQLHKCLLSLPEAEEDLKRHKGVAA